MSIPPDPIPAAPRCGAHVSACFAHAGGPRAGAKGGPGGAAGALPSLLGPERLAALLPRLYRQQYDPSPK
jgi:hypothetical protein